MCNKAVDNDPHALDVVSEYYKTQKDKAVWYISFYKNTCSWLRYGSRNVW